MVWSLDSLKPAGEQMTSMIHSVIAVLQHLMFNKLHFQWINEVN